MGKVKKYIYIKEKAVNDSPAFYGSTEAFCCHCQKSIPYNEVWEALRADFTNDHNSKIEYMPLNKDVSINCLSCKKSTLVKAIDRYKHDYITFACGRRDQMQHGFFIRIEVFTDNIEKPNGDKVVLNIAPKFNFDKTQLQEDVSFILSYGELPKKIVLLEKGEVITDTGKYIETQIGYLSGMSGYALHNQVERIHMIANELKLHKVSDLF